MLKTNLVVSLDQLGILIAAMEALDSRDEDAELLLEGLYAAQVECSEDFCHDLTI